MNRRILKSLIAMVMAIVMSMTLMTGISMESKAAEILTYNFHDFGFESREYKGESGYINATQYPETFTNFSDVKVAGTVTFSSSCTKQSFIRLGGQRTADCIGLCYADGNLYLGNYTLENFGIYDMIVEATITPEQVGKALADVPLAVEISFVSSANGTTVLLTVEGKQVASFEKALSMGSVFQIQATNANESITVNACDLEKQEGYKASITEDTAGKRSCWKCRYDSCGKMYSDELGTKEITEADLEIALPTVVAVENLTYNGKEQIPGVTIIDTKGDEILPKHYTVSKVKDVGRHEISITFNENDDEYESAVIPGVCTVNPPATAISSISTGVSKPVVKWTKKTDGVTGYELQYSTSSTFKNPKTVKVAKNSTVSKAVSMTAGKRCYVRIRTYKVVGSNPYYSAWSAAKSTYVPSATAVKSVTPGSKKLTVKWTKKTACVTGYQIQYSTSSKFKSPKTATVSKNKTTSKTITKLTGKKKYYVRIRTYYKKSGKTYYSAWSAKKYATTKK